MYRLISMTTEGDTTEKTLTAIDKLINNFKNIKTEDLLLIIFRLSVAFFAWFAIIFVYRHFWKRWSKTHTPKLKDRFVYNIVQIILYVSAGITVVLQIPNTSGIVESILTSSGFIALGLGLAAQESLSNIINGLMLSISKPFEVGDRIHLINGKITGYVEDITLRHTVIRTFVNSRIIIPNSSINKDMVENSNYQRGRASAFVDVTITFDSDVDKAREIMAKVMGKHPKFLDIRSKADKDKGVPKVKVFIRELGINGVMLRSSMWTASIDDNFEACSDVRYEIKKHFDRAGILLAQIPARPEASARASAYIDESGQIS